MTLRVGGAYAGWGIPDKNATSASDRARRTVYDEFQKTHPDIRLERYSALAIQGPASESGILMAFAGGTAPDIVYVNMRLLRNYATQGFLRPLNDFYDRDPAALDRVQPRIKRELFIDGKLYSVPSAQFVQALYYRKDLFRAAGLNPNKPPQNWDEFYQYAQTLTDQSKGQWGFAFEQGSESYYWINFLWSAGGEIAGPGKDGSKTYLARFNTPAGEQALEFYRKLLLNPWKDKDGRAWTGVASRTTTRKQDISSGKVGMWFAYQSDDIANMNQFDLNPSLLGIAPMPRGPSGKTGNELNASMWSVNAQVKDPAKLAAAWEFLRWMGSEEASRVRVQSYVENGLGELVNPVELQKYGYEDYITPASRQWIKSSQTLFANGIPEPNGPNMAFIYKLLNEPLDTAVLHPERPAKQILDDSVTKINIKILNYTPPAVLARQRLIAWSVVAVLGGIASFLLSRLIVETLRVARLRRSSGEAAANPSIPMRIHLAAWAFMVPAVASIALWAYLPLGRGLVMAFQDYRILGGSRWVGMDNFIEAWSQETFWRGITNSFLFTAWLLGLGFVMPIIAALLLNEIPKGKVLFRTLYYLPTVLTSVVVAMLWKQFWDPSASGLANSVLSWMHIAPQKWLQDPSQAMFAVVLPLVWASAGPSSIIYVAALQSIPDEMYEAADLDGAGFFTKIFRVTLPTLSPLIVINLVGATVAAFKIMEPILVQTGGGPENATTTIGLEVWYNAFMYLKFGYATAAAWMMGMILIALTIYQLRMLQNMRFAAGNR
ncbi:MAG: extracellular solute-binding protein [Cytophagales bacterium]|nr:extracellular solute-binding protein [Armatimonadota bacterium]